MENGSGRGGGSLFRSGYDSSLGKGPEGEEGGGPEERRGDKNSGKRLGGFCIRGFVPYLGKKVSLEHSSCLCAEVKKGMF